MMAYEDVSLDLRDVEFVAYRGSGKGGQRRNKVATCVRATHIPSGIVVRATRERFLSKNKNAAIEQLERRLQNLDESRVARVKRDRYDAKPDAAFGGVQIRTCRLVGDPGITDHRTGQRYPLSVLDGAGLDRMIMDGLRQRAWQPEADREAL